MKKFKFLIILLIMFIFPVVVDAEENNINIHLFYGKGCPHCAAEEKFFDSYLKENDNVKLYTYEVWNNAENQKILKEVQKKLNKEESGVPYLVIGDKVIIGYMDGITDSKIKKEIENAINDENYRDYVGEITGITQKPSDENIKNNNDNKKSEMKKTDEKIDEVEKYEVPVLGKINPKTVSLPLLALVVGFVDGFNPCAMWILIFLITMLFNMKDRRKMWILGLTFIITSGIVYLAFMLTWLNLATFISKIEFVRLMIAFVAIIVGIWNLSKYSDSLSKKEDGCDVVDKKDRKKIMDSIKKITSEKYLIPSIIGIMILAVSVNIIELMCSIGLPLIFTQILAMNNLSIIEYVIYMFIYILFFLIDDLIIFFIAMKTSKITAISTKYTKYSHLVGGIIMLIIGILLIIKPELLMFNF